MPLSYMYGNVTTRSDVDCMLQLGPVLWEKTDAVCGGPQEAAAGSEATLGPTGNGLGQQDDQSVPRLRVVPTENPGFVLLYQVKGHQCTHQDEHLFSGDSIRQLNQRYCLIKRPGQLTGGSGPATSYSCDEPFDGYDMVPCLRANWWPRRSFSSGAEIETGHQRRFGTTSGSSAYILCRSAPRAAAQSSTSSGYLSLAPRRW